jgi:hypothetical protein
MESVADACARGQIDMQVMREPIEFAQRDPIHTRKRVVSKHSRNGYPRLRSLNRTPAGAPMVSRLRARTDRS